MSAATQFHTLALRRRHDVHHKDLWPGSGAAQRLTGHWSELLWDLACLDPVWLETRVPGVALRQIIQIQGLRIQDEIGQVEGASFKLYGFMNAWYALRALASDTGQRVEGFGIESADRTELLSLWIDAQAHPFALRTLLGTYRAEQGRVVPIRHPERDDGERSLAAHMHALVRRRERLGESLDIADLAESCGWLALTPARLQARGRLRLAAPELIPCFLESVADQSLTTRVMTGTSGAVQTFEGCFHAYRQCRDGWVHLLGEGVRLRLEPEAIDSAWVLERSGPGGTRHQLRLYGESGRALLLMEDVARPGQVANPIWRILINALFD